MVHDNGPKNITLSPPKCRCGLKFVSSVAKLMFIPTANGISPRIVAVAVRTTGVIRVRPACMIALRVLTHCSFNLSVNSTSSIPFLTTIPASATIPIPVIIIEMVMPKII